MNRNRQSLRRALQTEVAERKRIEEQLRVLTNALDAVANAIVITDHTGAIQSVNPAFTALTGYTAQEVVGQNPRLLKSGKQDEAFYRNLWQTISSGQVWSGELTNRRKDGNLFDEDMTITPLRNDDGVIARYIAIKQDITGRKRAESLVRQSEKRYRSLFDNARDAIFTIAADGTFTSLNSAVETMTGLSRADWIGQPFTPMVHPDDLPLAREMFHRILQGEQTPVHELRGHPSLKRPALMEMTLTPQKDEHGKIIGLLGIGRDITERKQAEAARNRLAAILESTTDMVSIADAAGRLIYLNHAGRSLLGVGLDEEITKAAFRDFLPNPDSHPVFTQGIPAALRQGTWSGETVLISRRGQAIPVSQVILAHKSPAGKLEFLSTIIRDITERKRLEANLFQSQKLETVGKLAGGIAHEFNSILTAILGQSELLLDDLPAGGSLAKNASEISRAAGRAATLTRQLLAFGRKQFLQPENLDLNQVLANMRGMFEHLMAGDVAMQIVPGPDLPLVRADAGQIEQVIMNMAINAREAMPNGGKLTFETANVSFDQESVGRYPELKAGEFVMLAITDTGAGMSEEAKAHVFEPFFSTKGVGQGTGLGLATCFGIVKQSGGHISVYSEPGRGATFKIYLPQAEPQSQRPVARLGSPDLPRGTETILLVEDDPALREMAATLLRRLGYTILPAANGVEALQLKQQRGVGHIDLLFTDVVMPHMSGKELTDRVQALNPHTKVLFTSAYTESAIVHQGVLDNGVPLLQKPFTPSALAHKLRKVLDEPQAQVVR